MIAASADTSAATPRPPWAIVTGDFVKTGGMDRANFALASYLARVGREVHLVAFRVADELRDRPNVHWHRVRKPLNSYTLALPLLDRAGRRVAHDIAARGRHVVANGGSCRCGDVNWVHYVHAAYTPQVGVGLRRRITTWWNHRRWLADERRAVAQAQIVIANSRRTRDDLVNRLGVPPQRVHVVYYGIDASEFRPATREERGATRQRLGWPPDARVVLFIGALSDRRKGFDTVFEAWRIARTRDRGFGDARLAVIGAGSEVPAWQRRASASGVGDTIEFLGFRSDVAALLRVADLLVAPTRYEAYGLGVHEALCCGVPALVTRSAGVAERLPPSLREPLLLGDNVTSAALAQRLLHWRAGPLVSAEALAALSDELRSRSWDDMAAEIVRVVEGAGHPAAGPEANATATATTLQHA